MITYEVNKKKNTREIGHSFLKRYKQFCRLSPNDCIPKLNEDYFLEMKETDPTAIKEIKEAYFLKSTLEAFNKLEKQDRILIYEKYISFESKDNINIFYSYSMSESTFYRKMKLALIHFVEAYNQGELLKKK